MARGAVVIAGGALAALVAAVVQVTLERDALATFGRRRYRVVLATEIVVSWWSGLLIPIASLAAGASPTAGAVAGALMITAGIVLDAAHRELLHGRHAGRRWWR